MMIIELYRPFARQDSAGKHKIEDRKTQRTADVVLSVDGAEVARTTVQRNVAGAFTASESFDVGIDLGSPVSLDYFDRAPFPFNGKIENMTVKLS